MALMPKRRKSKDNPYKLDYNDIEHIYKVTFLNNNNEIQTVIISEEVFNTFNKFELEDISQLHKVDKHIDGRGINDGEYTDIVLYHTALDIQKNVEDIVEEKLQNEELYKAINILSETQKRRVKLYYFDNYTLQEIADMEGCSPKNIYKSIEQAKEKLRKNLKK